MNTTPLFYEVWNAPDRGPLTVLERGPKGELGFTDQQMAIDWAKQRHATYPHMHFWVSSIGTSKCTACNRRQIVFKTNA